jgi:hypothetical protein
LTGRYLLFPLGHDPFQFPDVSDALLVFVAVRRIDFVHHLKFFEGNRNENKANSVIMTLRIMMSLITMISLIRIMSLVMAIVMTMMRLLIIMRIMTSTVKLKAVS